MQQIGGQKLDMPSLCSANLWKTSERWDLMGKELFRLKDRHDGDYCLGPTHEEAVTTLVAHQTTLSYKQLPLLLYQVTFLASHDPCCCKSYFYTVTCFVSYRLRANSGMSLNRGLVFFEAESST